jgi:ABC-type transporter Mla MlaB component
MPRFQSLNDWRVHCQFNGMLRITTRQETTKLVLQLEGDLTGTWVGDFLIAWRAARGAVNGCTLRIDLSAVRRIDKAGEYLLALVHCHGSQLTGSGIATRHLIRTIAREWPCTNSHANKEA